MPRVPDLLCSICGTLMARSPNSLPDGKATCHPCRRARPKNTRPKDTRGHRDYSYKKSLPCSLCGVLMWRGATSAPEGKATCLPCRRARATQKKSSKRVPIPCRKCGTDFIPRGDNSLYCRGHRRIGGSGRKGPGYKARGGWANMKAISELKARGAVQTCWSCGFELWATAQRGELRWMTIGHYRAIEDGGTLWDPAGYGPQCAPCNFSDGARRTNAKLGITTHDPSWYEPYQIGPAMALA